MKRPIGIGDDPLPFSRRNGNIFVILLTRVDRNQPYSVCQTRNVHAPEAAYDKRCDWVKHDCCRSQMHGHALDAIGADEIFPDRFWFIRDVVGVQARVKKCTVDECIQTVQFALPTLKPCRPIDALLLNVPLVLLD